VILNIAKSENFRANLQAAGLIPAVVWQLRSPAQDLLEAAVETLTTMATNNGRIQDLILEAGGVQLLLKFFEQGNDDAKALALKALACFAASNSAIQEVIRAYGIFPVVCELLSSRYSEVQRTAAAALCAFSDGNARVQNEIFKLGALALLSKLLVQANETAQAIVVDALRALAHDNIKIQDYMRENNFLPIISDLLFKKSIQLLIATSNALLEILKDNEKNQDAFNNSSLEVMNRLVDLLGHSDATIALNCIKIVSVLVKKKGKRRKWIQETRFKETILMTSNSSNNFVRKSAESLVAFLKDEFKINKAR